MFKKINCCCFGRCGCVRSLGYKNEVDLLKYVKFPNPRKLPNELNVTLCDRLKLFFRKKSTISLVYIMEMICLLVIYVTTSYSTYASTPEEGEERERELAVEIIEIIATFFYFHFFFLEWYMNSNLHVSYVFLFFSLWDFVTHIPVVFLYFFDLILWDKNWLWSLAVVDEKFYYFFTPLRMLRMGFVFRYTFSLPTKFRSRFVDFLLTTFVIMSGMVLSAWVLLLFDNCTFLYNHREGDEVFIFNDSIYLMFQTLTTIGYGDMTPNTIPGKMLIIVFFTFAAYVIVSRLSVIYEFIQYLGDNSSSAFNEFTFGDHTIVTGSKLDDILEFLIEFYQERHGIISTSRVLVVVSSESDRGELQTVFRHRHFSERVTVACGSLEDYEFLEQISAEYSNGVFILSDLSSSSDEHDTATLMTVNAVKNYHKPSSVFCMARTKQTARLLRDSGAIVVSVVNQIESEVTVRSGCSALGFSTFVSHLLHSADCPSFHIKKGWSIFLRRKEENEMSKMMKEYLSGAAHGIYLVRLPEYFFKKKVRKGVWMSYKLFDVFLIGVCRRLEDGEEEEEEEEEDTRIIMFDNNEEERSMGLKFQEGDVGVVLARSNFHAHTLQYISSSIEAEEEDEVEMEEFSEEEEEGGGEELKLISTSSGSSCSSVFGEEEKEGLEEELEEEEEEESMIEDEDVEIIIDEELEEEYEGKKWKKKNKKRRRRIKENVIVLLGSVDRNKCNLVMGRMKSMMGEEDFEILILSEDDILDDDDEEEELKKRIKWMKGSENYVNDLEKIPLEKTRSIIYFAGEDDEDSTSVRVMMNIRSVVSRSQVKRTPQVIIEYNNRRNLKYFPSARDCEKQYLDGPKVIPALTTSFAMARNAVDDTLRQTFNFEEERFYFNSFEVATGSCFAKTSFFIRMLAYSFYITQIGDLVKNLCGSISSFQLDEETMKIIFNDGRKREEVSTFELFEKLLMKHDVLMVGVRKANGLVFCSPRKSFSCCIGDSIFFVGKKGNPFF